MMNPFDYLTQGLSREQLLSIGKRQLKVDAPRYASDLNNAPLPHMDKKPVGFNRDDLKAIGDGKLRGQVTFVESTGVKEIRGVPMQNDVTRIIPIEKIEAPLHDFYNRANFTNPIRIK